MRVSGVTAGTRASRLAVFAGATNAGGRCSAAGRREPSGWSDTSRCPRRWLPLGRSLTEDPFMAGLQALRQQLQAGGVVEQLAVGLTAVRAGHRPLHTEQTTAGGPVLVRRAAVLVGKRLGAAALRQRQLASTARRWRNPGIPRGRARMFVDAFTLRTKQRMLSEQVARDHPRSPRSSRYLNSSTCRQEWIERRRTLLALSVESTKGHQARPSTVVGTPAGMAVRGAPLMPLPLRDASPRTQRIGRRDMGPPSRPRPTAYHRSHTCYHRGMTRKRRLTVTVDPDLVDAGNAAVAAGQAQSLSEWVNTALLAKTARDRRLGALADAIAAFEQEHGAISADEIAAQQRADRAVAVVVRGSRSDAVKGSASKPRRTGAA